MPPDEGGGNLVALKVYEAVTTLLDTALTMAMALIVSDQRTVSGPVYNGELPFGVLPSRVIRTTPLYGMLIATWCGFAKVVPVGTLKTGSLVAL